ncbi:MFS transporter [Candidatus Pacearchaeota archaeon]|nr:MFS transporter [Candidatus Pacearchaeota archaeon]
MISNSTKKEHSKESVARKKQRALKISIKEGSASGFSDSIGSTYIVPFVKELNGGAIHVGILSAVSGLIAPIAQFFGNNLMEKYSRKRIVSRFTLIQGLLWIPIAILGFLFWKNIALSYLIPALIILYVLLAATGGIVFPALFSWMGDLIQEKSKGSYFGKRNRIISIVSLIALVFAAISLSILKNIILPIILLSLFFIIAFISKYISYKLIKKQYEPKFRLKGGYYFSLWAFINRFDNYGKFTIYHAFFNFAIMIASPFFAIYMLEELNLNYIIYTIVTMSSSVFYLLFTPLVGKFSDRYGNKKLLHLSTFLFSINPLLWIFIKSPIILILVPQLLVGLANAALVIGVTNFTYDSVSAKHRGLCVAYFNILTGIGIFIGSLLGGFLIKYVQLSSYSPYLLVFALAFIMRSLVSIIFLPKIKEVKKVSRLPPMHVNITHPFKSLHSEIGWFRKISNAR